MNNKARKSLLIVAIVVTVNSTTHTAEQDTNIEATKSNLLEEIKCTKRNRYFHNVMMARDAVNGTFLDNDGYLDDVNIDNRESDYSRRGESILSITKTIASATTTLTNYLEDGWHNIDEANLLGETALHVASKVNNLDLAQILVEHKANVDAQTKRGVTPIMLAAAYKNYEMVTFLLKKNANIKLKTCVTNRSVFDIPTDVKIKELLQDHTSKESSE